MVGKHKQKNLDWTKRWLRKHFFSEYPVKVLLKNKVVHDDWDESLDGLTVFDNKKQMFVIYINKNTNIDTLIEILLHEWAHVMRNHAPENAQFQSHDDVYWAHYGQIFRKWHGE